MDAIVERGDTPGLYPPRIEPPARPLPTWRFLPLFLRNPLRTLPAAVYEQDLFVPPRLGGRMAWATAPALASASAPRARHAMGAAVFMRRSPGRKAGNVREEASVSH